MTRIIYFLLIFLSSFSSIFGLEQFDDQLVKGPEIKGPERGTIKGEFSSMGDAAVQPKTGSFSFSIPLDIPTSRGKMIIAPSFNYSPGFGMSSMGIGIEFDLKIERVRQKGLIQFNNDDLMSTSWGLFVPSSKESGVWYKKGGQAKDRLVISDDQDEMTLYFSDGRKANFLSSSSLSVGAKTLIWYLSYAVDKNGNRTKYQYLKNDSGKLYLESIYYGGHKDQFQHKLEISYQEKKSSSHTYLRKRKIKDDLFIERISFFNKENDEYSKVHLYSFGYQQSNYSPAFYLKNVQKIYSSGAKDPLVKFEYNNPMSFIENQEWKEYSGADHILSSYQNSTLTHKYFNFVDFDKDGLIDIESFHGKSRNRKNNYYERYSNTLKGFSESTRVEISNLGVSKRCYSNGAERGESRSYADFLGPNEDSFIYAFYRQSSNNQIEVCDKSGKLLKSIYIPRGWYQEEIILADMNNDQLPDIVRLTKNQKIEYLLNISKGKEIQFERKINNFQIKFRGPYLSYWVRDINGDSHNDLIIKINSKLIVHYGLATGGYSFNSYAWRFYSRLKSQKNGNSIADISKRNFLFLDINKDSLPDILSTKTGKLEIFLNTGNDFVNYYPKGFALKHRELLTVRAADFLGVGTPQIILLANNRGQLKIKSFSLDYPGLGMIQAIDDGKGTRVTYDYGLSPIEPGINSRRNIIKKLKKTSVGQGDIAYDYSYKNSIKDPLTFMFSGFENIILNTLKSKNTKSYIYKFGEGVLKEEIFEDKQNFKVTNKIEFKYDFINDNDSEYGVNTILKLREIKGSVGAEEKEVTHYLSYDSNYCPLIIEKGAKRPIVSSFDYASVEAMDHHRTCLPSNAEIKDKINGKAYHLEIKYDEEGRKKEILILGKNRNNRLQTIKYSSGRIKSIKNAHGGIDKYSYDKSYRLKKTQGPNGRIIKINQFADDDQTKEIEENLGTGNLLSFYRYNNRSRLFKKWDNIGDYSEDRPKEKIFYRYADSSNAVLGNVKVLSLFEKNKKLIPNNEIYVQSASGELLANITPTQNGHVIKSITKFEEALNTKKQYAHVRKSDIGLDTLTARKLYTDKRELVVTQNDLTNQLNYSKETYHRDVNKETMIFDIIEGGKTTKIKAHGCSKQSECLSIPHSKEVQNGIGKIESIVDEEGNKTDFDYDGFGRLIKMTLPDGKLQTFDYDENLPKISNVKRDGIGQIQFHYNSAGSVERKEFFDNNDKLNRTELYSYDQAARVKSKKLSSINDKDELNYSYQGSLIQNVSSLKFQKNFEYLNDGKIKSIEMKANSVGSISVKKKYYFHGDEKEILYESNVANKEMNTKISFDLNEAGKVGKVLVNGKALVKLEYDDLLRLSHVVVNGKKEKILFDDYSQKKIGFKSKESQYKYAYNNKGLVSQEDYSLSKNQSQKQYLYSENGQLISCFESGTKKQTLNYDYDQNGLIQKFEIENELRMDIKLNESTWRNGRFVYKLDSLGRVIKKDDKVFSYGANGRILKAYVKDNVFHYIYDEENNLIAKKGKNLNHLYLKNVSVINGSLYIPIKVGNRILGFVRDNVFYRQSSDLRNSIIMTGDKKTNIPAPYGMRDVRNEELNSVDFALKGYDEHIGALRNGHRWYDPEIRLFLTPDLVLLTSPSGLIQSPLEANLYSYSKNNPINFIDPSGDVGITLALLIVAGVNSGAMGALWLAGTASIKLNGALTGKDVSQDQKNLNTGVLVGAALGATPAVVSGAVAYAGPATTMAKAGGAKVAGVLGQAALTGSAALTVATGSAPATMITVGENALEFIDNFMGSFDSLPTTGTPATTPGGVAGTFMGKGVKAAMDSAESLKSKK
jgi:RHS repeat-associated protein